jgi:P4 family phage/plasmid primase-like protien
MACDPLSRYLSRWKVTGDSDFTHTSLSGGKFYIAAENDSTFFELYKATIGTYTASLTEKPREQIPIIIDLDFRQKTEEHQYTDDHIHQILQALLNVIDEYLAIPRPTTVYVLTKPARKCKNTIKDGLHIMMPSIVASVNFHKFLRHSTYKTIYDILQPCDYVNGMEDIYDKCTTTNNWMMYGSKKPDEPYPWTLTHMYEYDNGLLKRLEIATDMYDLPETLSIRNKFTQTPIKMDIPDLPDTRSEVSSSVARSQLTFRTTNNDQVTHVKTLLSFLSPRRAEEYHSWIRVGWCLHNIDDSFLPLWEEFSAQSPKYVAGECERLWYSMRKDGLNIGTLCRWAKEDSPAEYVQSNKRTLTNLIYKSITKYHYDIARVVHHMYGNEYVSIFIEKAVLRFQFYDHRWHEESWSSLNTRLATDVVDEYTKIADSIQQLANAASTEDERDGYLATIKRFRQMPRMLKNVSSVNNILKQCEILFEKKRKDFFDMLNSKMNLIGFEDGVFDLDTNTFRDGQPEDLVTFSTGYKFPRKSYPDTRKFLDNFLTSITPSPEMKQYLLDVLSYTCHGDKKFHDNNLCFWSGSGANGKGALKNLCMKTFGGYAYEPDPTMITCCKTDSSKPTPELSRVQGKRFTCMSEPERNQKFQISLLKRLTGGDQVQSRDMYKTNVEFTPTSIFIVLMNNKPTMNDFDGGIARRLNIVDFPYKFVVDPKLDHERLIDCELNNKINDDPRCVPEFMLMLLENYQRVKTLKSIPKPAAVIAETQRYLEENNTVKEFIERYLVITKNPKDCILSTEMFSTFKTCDLYNFKDVSWFKEQMRANGLKSEQKQSRGQYYKMIVYSGVKFIEITDDNEDPLLDLGAT